MKKQLCSEAVLAYKNALRNDPSDDETRYNLVLAKKCEEEQQNDDQNKDDQNKDSEDNDNQNKNDQNNDDNKSEKPKENKNQQSKLSPQQIKNLLKAMENTEKKVQAKVNDKKQKGTKVVSEKDW